MSSPPRVDTVGLAGLGLIGGSIALGIRECWPAARLVVFDRPDRLEEGARLGVVDRQASSVADLAGCDLVVLAVPVAAMADLIVALGAANPTGVITDVGSAKREVVAAAERGGLRRFVGAHPMAGGEQPGLAHARRDLFLGRPWLILADAADEDAAVVERLALGMGARPKRVSADEHDRLMAYVSHLPQVLATALMNAAREAVGVDGLACAGPAFGEMTRLAASSAEVWQGILSQNADFTSEAVARFVAHLPTPDRLQTGDWVREAFSRTDTSSGRTGTTGSGGSG